MTITVLPRNDAPSFKVGLNKSVHNTAPEQRVLGWATEIRKGPANEDGQTLTFLVANDHNELFAAQPAVDANGTLTFQPKVGTAGTATVTVQLKDDGGTANGGADTSPPQTFTITVE